MAAYFIVDLEVTEPVRFKANAEAIPATVSAFGGKYLVASGTIENIEGDWNPQKLIVIEFETIERAKKWWESENYREIKEIRLESSNAKILLTVGQ